MSKKIKTVADKLEKVNESFSIYMYDNGYMLEISGNNELGNWASAKIVVPTIEELLELIKETSELPRTD